MDKSRAVIMSIDDDPDTLRFVDEVLQEQGCRVIAFDSGKKALSMVETDMPDLILLDVNMPDMNGYEICAKLQENEITAHIPVVFLSGCNEQQDESKAFSVGAADYLRKPITCEKLIDKVEERLQTHQEWKELLHIVGNLNIDFGDSDEISTKTIKRPFVKQGTLPSDFIQFKSFLCEKLSTSDIVYDKVMACTFKEIYQVLPSELGISQNHLAQCIAEFLHFPYLPVIQPETLSIGIIPMSFSRKNGIVSIRNPQGQQAFALSNPFNWDLIDCLKRYVQNLRLMITAPNNISIHLRTSTTKQEITIGEIEKQIKDQYGEGEEIEIAEDANEESAPIVLLINNLIENAYKQGASDIHIEPWEYQIVVRYRIDGNMQVVNRLKPQSLIRPMLARLKIMSGLNIAERRRPQDGRIIFKKFAHTPFDFDLRLATSPMNFGEKAVLRILDKQKSIMPLDQLGFSKRHLEKYREAILASYGLILHVGPTGSGKSMSLYAALNEIQSPIINIQTIEDPIEYTIEGINQLQVNSEIGLTFGDILRSYLRQDPDIILVGEIRDKETAEIAIEAALTGHLLLSTLHTNDASSTVLRLSDMGIEPFLVSSSLVMVCAQRLLRRLCSNCKQEYSPTAKEKLLAGIPAVEDSIIYQGKGCEKCKGVGYKGRISAHELLILNDEIRAAVTQGVSTEDLKKLSVKKADMTTLYWDAMEKVREGICSLESVLAKIRKDEFDSRPEWMLS